MCRKLLLLVLVLVLEITLAKVIKREEDFYTIEINYPLKPIREACQMVKKSEEKMMLLGLIRPSDQLNMDKMVVTLLQQCAKGLATLYETDIDNSSHDILKEGPDFDNHQHFIRFKKWDALGEFWHWASGSPGPTEYAAQERNFVKIRRAFKQQYSINEKDDKEMNILRHNGNRVVHDISKLSDELRKTNQAVTNTTNELERHKQCVSFYSACVNTLIKTLHEVNQLNQAIQLAEQGYLSRDLVPAHELKVILNKVTQRNFKLQPVFSAQKIEQYYKLKVSVAIRAHGKVFFYVRIPLVDPTYRARLQPISSQHKQLYGLASDFFLIESGNLSYSTVTRQQVNNFFKLGHSGYLSSDRRIDIRIGATSDLNSHLEQVWIDRVSQLSLIHI